MEVEYKPQLSACYQRNVNCRSIRADQYLIEESRVCVDMINTCQSHR